MPGTPVKQTIKKSQQQLAATELTQQTYKWLSMAILAVTALIYSRALQNGITSMDDDYYILKNPYLKDFSAHGIKAIFTSFYSSNYHPLTTLTFWLEYHFFGTSPLPYHLLNVVLHVANTWLVLKFTEKLSGHKITALVVASLFALHPLHVESVAWISERKDVLYAFFYLVSLRYYLSYLTDTSNKKMYAATLLFFLCSLCAKSAAVTLPLLLVAIDIYKGRKITTASLIEKVPFFALSITFGILNIMAQKTGGALNNLMVSYGFINGIFLFTSGLAFYITHLVAPYGLSVMHYYPEVPHGVLPWMYYVSLPFLLLVVWLVIRKNVMRKEILFGSAFFLITISVMLQVISVGSALTAERYTYLSYIGLFYIAGQWLAANQKQRQLANAIFIALIAVFSMITWNRIATWKDDRTIYTDIIEKNPDVYYGYWLMGNLDKEEDNKVDALDNYTHAIALNPKFEDSWYNRGNIYLSMGNFQSAIDDYSHAIAINKRSAEAYNNRGWASFSMGNTAAAMADYSSAIALKPQYADAYNNRGWGYEKMGNPAAAIADYTSAIKANPAFVKPLYNRAAINARAGNFAAAMPDYDQLIKLHPDDAIAYQLRGLTWHNLKETAKACSDWKRSVELGNQQAVQMLGQYCR